jgi:hypothetical protein
VRSEECDKKRKSKAAKVRLRWPDQEDSEKFKYDDMRREEMR